jgi:polyisoprenoid-binding protein YceI
MMDFLIFRRGTVLGFALVLGMIGFSDTLSAAGGKEPPGVIEFVGKNMIATANGVFHSWHIVESHVDAATINESFALIEVDLASVDTGNNRRDDHLRDPDFFDVETYPVARVRVHSARPNGQTDEGRPRFAVNFDIDLHGVQQTLAGEIVMLSEIPLVFEGRLIVDRTKFGIGPPPSGWKPLAVGAEIPIRFEVEL